ncbi:uncharacterized protein LOC126371516 isoform X1 [Pectinophora gossypiella]|uniref:uncharacterized protein LOC126371516 isoform X1 n=1 Tax=Pectinophora gossypiella TaxID=13191 RepID=UPI00214EC4F3|nr:uncharacterized protein LOC126371516 isoform X1 [Pectinophora gossypiella]
MMYLLLIFLVCSCSAMELEDKFDRYIISCHSTDFECFRRQYKNLRDHVLMGNMRLGIPTFENYIFKYGNTGTCIKLGGLEQSELGGIQLDTNNKELIWTLDLPFKIQQIQNFSARCVKPENVLWTSGLVWLDRRMGGRRFRIRLPRTPRIIKHARKFTNIDPKLASKNGPLKKFTGNATIQVSYPYTLKKKRSEVYMVLGDENLDVILDIPDLSHYNKNSPFERNLYELSEWAYGIVQHIDAAQHFALPFTSRLRVVMEFLPLRRFLLVYPEEDYLDMRFRFTQNYIKCTEKCSEGPW